MQFVTRIVAKVELDWTSAIVARNVAKKLHRVFKRFRLFCQIFRKLCKLRLPKIIR